MSDIKTVHELIAVMRSAGLSDRSIRRRANISARQFRILTRRVDGICPVVQAEADILLRKAMKIAEEGGAK